MTDFEKYWPTACLPGEYDSMDACDQGRWRGVAQAAYQAGREAMKAECQQECSAEATDNGTAQRIAKAIGELK